MAFGRKDDAGEPMSSMTTSSSSGSASGFGNLTAFIDQGSEFEGKLSFKDTVRIDGRFSGEISSENTLIVGESGEIEADIHSPAVVISGTVVGDVHASRQLVMHKTARLTGDVSTPSLVMEEGATLNGGVKMERSSGAAKAPSKPEARPSSGGSAPSASGSSAGSSGSSGSSGSK
jgi:cytoskeletal protein CcmA (bactofilin family)